jgi:serine/threonine protein kinase
MLPLVACPDRETLRLLLLGHTSGPEGERLAEHLEQCPCCTDLARTLHSDDTLTESARSSGGLVAALEEGVQDLVDRLRRLGPPDPAEALTLPLRTSPAATADREYAFLAPPRQPGEIGWLGSYRILRVLGCGGMGIVFAAEDTRLARTVALKVMRPEVASKPQARERFLREARAAAALEHENVVSIYHIGEERGVPFLAMQWLKGTSLEERLERVGALSVLEVVSLGRQVALGLAAAHEKGLIHRDIKPANLWLEGATASRCPASATGGRVKILDFGLVHALGDDVHLTQSGTLVGTLCYMAPEQVDNCSVGPHSDLFSLGVVLYRACTGKLPFEGSTPLAALRALAVESPRLLQEIAPAVPNALAALVMQLLERNPADRPGSAQEVADRLASIEQELTGQSVTAVLRPAPCRQPPSAGAVPPVRRARWKRLLLVAAALLALLPLGWLYGGVVIRFATNRGQLIVQVDDPNVEVTVKHNGVIVRDRSVRREFTLTAGNGEVEVYEKASGLKLATRKFTLRRGGTTTVTVELAPPAKAPGALDRKVAQWVLSLGGKVRVCVAGHKQHVLAARDLPAGAFQLDKIRLDNNQRVRDADLTGLRGLPDLVALELKGTQIGDAGLARLERFSNLQYLGLRATRISNAGLVRVGKVTSLTRLVLIDCQVSDAGLLHLKGLHDLQGLFLTGTPIGDAGVAHLAGFRKLKSLFLKGTRVGDAGLARLAGLRGLEELDLSGTPVNDAGCKHLAGLTRLRELDLTGTRVTAAGLAELFQALPKCRIRSGPRAE